MAGGSDGLGAAFAWALARRKLNLLLVARRADQLDITAGLIGQACGVEVKTLSLDLAEAGDLSELIRQARALDVGLLVCNAASAPLGDFLEVSAEQHRRVIDTNCRAAALLVHALGEKMAERGRGGIILVSSMAGFQGTALVAHYAATKAYLRVLAEGLWKELGEKGVDVLACCAGLTDTATYRKTNPRPSGKWAGAPMDPEVVVDEALAALGKGPVLVPGKRNRLAQTIMQRVMPKKLAISIISAGTRAIYPKRT